jgi:hypothetical protein
MKSLCFSPVRTETAQKRSHTPGLENQKQHSRMSFFFISWSEFYREVFRDKNDHDKNDEVHENRLATVQPLLGRPITKAA